MVKSNELSLTKILATVSIIAILMPLLAYASLKAFNSYIDLFVNHVLDVLSLYGFNLSVEQFWVLIALILLFIVVVIFTKRDS